MPAKESRAPAIHRIAYRREMKLDIFPHIFPPAYFERMESIAGRNPALAAQIKRWLHIPVLWNLERRMMMAHALYFGNAQRLLRLGQPRSARSGSAGTGG